MMDAKTAAALEASIKHWEENVAAETLEDVSISAFHCALCSLFIENDCNGCPVMAWTGKTRCEGSPYVLAEIAFDTWDNAEDCEIIDAIDSARDAWRKAAQAELDFLISLREPKT